MIDRRDIVRNGIRYVSLMVSADTVTIERYPCRDGFTNYSKPLPCYRMTCEGAQAFQERLLHHGGVYA